MDYKVLEYNSWNNFKSDVYFDLCNEPLFPEKKYIFRGQRNPNWPLMSGFDRMFGSFDFDKREKIEKSLIKYFREYCNEINYEDINKYDDSIALTLAQHYGLPTRLLDWSYSIYVAAFFAFAYNRNDISDNASIWVIDTSHQIWKNTYGVNIITSRIKENEYQKRQKGLFTQNNSADISLEDYVTSCKKRCNVSGALTQIIIPFSERNSILRDLEMMGINHLNLFSEFDGCAQSAIVKTFVENNLT